tara:strand:+ start:1360 stop:2397 length:1038 start_codon:yes stop_codon:yes gene_type:complete
MTVYTLGVFLEDKESLSTEYKEFCLKDNIYKLVSDRQIQHMIYRGVFPKRFDEVVLFNIYKYLDVYLPKYASAFHNSSGLESMMLVVGVDDSSEVTGIPFKGDLSCHERAFQRYADSLLRTELQDMCCVALDLRVEECSIEETLLDDTILSEQLQRYQNQQGYTRLVQRKYQKHRRKWNKDIMRYKGKLQSVFDDPMFQKEFREFLKTKDLLASFEKELSEEKYLVDLNKVRDHKLNEGTFVWWLIQFKDQKVQECMTRKPKAPILSKQLNVEVCTVTQLTNLRLRWLKNNPSLKYYVLRIHIRKDPCFRTISFIDPRRKHWRTIRRYLADNEPRSTDILASEKN